MSPRAASAQRLAWLVLTAAEACRELGSPFYSQLLDRIAEDVLAGGPAATVLAGHEDDARSSALALRLMGGTHRLVLEGRVPELAAFYPSVGGNADAEAAWPAFRAVLEEHRDELVAGLAQPPQTNEVGRAAALVGGLLHVPTAYPTALRLFELGASAGLNLRADHFRIALPDGTGVGPADSPVVLADPWQGPPPPIRPRLDVVERAGCDTAPLDPTSADGRLRLVSYVWPDQLERLDRLRGALDLAAAVPAPVHHQAAVDFAAAVDLEPGTTTVLWHSVFWQYLSRAERDAVSARVDELGARATAGAAFAHLHLEPQRRYPGGPDEFLVRLRTWPSGDDRILAVAHPHGVPTTWE